MSIPEALFAGKNKIYLEETISTNTYALDLLSKTNPPEGTCIITDFQTAGRGQIGRYWHSEAEKNLLVTYIFYPHTLKVKDQFYLNIISGLAMRDVAAHWIGNVKIKWPNDIYSGDKKLAGILVQNVLRGDFIKSTIIGVGINVNQQDFPPDIPNPISIALIKGFDIDVELVLRLLSARLEYYYLRLKANRIKILKDEYLNSLYRFNEWAQFSDSDNDTFKGKIAGIDQAGKLILQTETKGLKSFGFREVSYVI
ncbi:MAG: biotin--[acetyl-CoA-carboxylase] ligase [Saprospiraceae bacterium]|jgi:BirA family biotin operon repressor/biotin-[acetyl-CoA-carboxylase] ligase|nr:biotin--[acetyl-CoA-carboxylase] ligase [Saprospiraceae bacterium]